jgi:hypothetical protein
VPGEGLRVAVPADIDLAIPAPVNCPPIPAGPGTSLVGFPCAPEGSTAFSLLRGGQESRLRRLLPGTETYEEATWEGGRLGGVDFPIVRGEAYFVVLSSTSKVLRRGDSNADGTTNLSDAITILGYLFLGSPMNDCKDAADVNDDGKVDMSDPVRLLGHLFLGSEPPPAPFGVCGVDPTEDDLDCNTFAKCP